MPSKHRALFGLAWVACVSVTVGCLPDAAFKHRGPTQPEPLDDGWEIATPTSVGLDPVALSAIHDQLLREDRSFGAVAMMVIKDGKLVWETYLRSLADRDRINHIQSATKSVTSLAVGLARAHGHLLDLDATLGELLPDAVAGLDPQKAQITLDHLLTMRSGIDFENEDFALEMWLERPDDPLRHILSKPLYAAPGERFHYRDADPQVVSYVVQAAVGMREEEWVQRHLLSPLGISDYQWESGPDGASLGPDGLHLRPRDFAKLGLFLLDGCRWRGEALVPADYCTLATREHVPAEETDNPRRREALGYGYYFWTLPNDEGVYAAWGHGGQYLLIVPDKNMVLVQTGLPDTSNDLHGNELPDFIELTAPLWR